LTNIGAFLQHNIQYYSLLVLYYSIVNIYYRRFVYDIHIIEHTRKSARARISSTVLYTYIYLYMHNMYIINTNNTTMMHKTSILFIIYENSSVQPLKSPFPSHARVGIVLLLCSIILRHRRFRYLVCYIGNRCYCCSWLMKQYAFR